MPKLIRLYITQVLIGFLLSAVFLVAVIVLDIAGLRGLILGSSSGYIAGGMLFMANGIIFAGAQFAIRILLMADDDDDDPKGGRRLRVVRSRPVDSHATVPVPVRIHK